MSENMTHTILFVDDEKSILKALQRLFFDEDFHILTADSGKAALALLAAGEKPAVIISDQRMPEMGGAEFLAQARKMLPESIRMVLTGYADINAAVDAVNLGGIYRYILKPWNDEDLKLTVKEAISRFDLIEENKKLSLELEKNNRTLAALNASLEQKVVERTRALRQIVRELQGRDRIQQYLMEIHPLPELLATILVEVNDLASSGGCAFFLQSGDEGMDPVPAAAIDFDARLDSEGFEPLAQAVRQAATADNPPNLTTTLARHTYAVMPVRKGSKKFGALVVKKDGETPFHENRLQNFASFANQAAIDIHDCRLQENFDDIEASLDDVLATI
jgi:FixJ family two-component response regulator